MSRIWVLGFVGTSALLGQACAADQTGAPPGLEGTDAVDADGGVAAEETEGTLSAALSDGCTHYISLYNAADGYVRGYGQVVCDRPHTINVSTWITRNGTNVTFPIPERQCTNATYCQRGATHWDNAGVQHWCVRSRAGTPFYTSTVKVKCGDF